MIQPAPPLTDTCYDPGSHTDFRRSSSGQSDIPLVPTEMLRGDFHANRPECMRSGKTLQVLFSIHVTKMARAAADRTSTPVLLGVPARFESTRYIIDAISTLSHSRALRLSGVRYASSIERESLQ